MLDTFRRGPTKWISTIFLGILIVSLAVWGITDVFLAGPTGNTVAEVGETEIETITFQRIYNAQIVQASSRLGTSITPELALQFGFPQNILGALIADAALNEKARVLGIGLSDETVARDIANDPAVQLTPGQFDAAYFNQLLAQNGITEDEYVTSWRAYMLRQQLRELLFGEVAAPQALVAAVSEFTNEVRTVRYVVLDPAIVQPIEAPAEDVLAAYFADNAAALRTAEFRTATLLDLSPTSRLDLAAITDEQVRAEYDRAISSFSTPERRRVLQVLFPTLAEAEAAYSALAGGTDFAPILAARGVTEAEADLGVVTVAQMADPAIAAGAFALEPNVISMPIEGRFGAAIVLVTEVQPGVTRPFEAVAEEIRTALATAIARDEIASLYDEILDAEAGGQPLAEIGANLGVPVLTVTINSAGEGPDGAPVMLPAAPGLLTGIFATDVDVENAPEATNAGTYVWYEVTEIVPPADRTLEEARAEVVAAWQAEEAERRLADRAEGLRAAVAGGMSLEDAAAAAGLTMTTSGPLTRAAVAPELGEAAVRAAFAGPVGYTVAVSGPAASRIVLVVNEVLQPEVAPGDEAAVTLAGDLSTRMQSGLLQRYTGVLQTELDAVVNETAFQQAIGLQ